MSTVSQGVFTAAITLAFAVPWLALSDSGAELGACQMSRGAYDRSPNKWTLRSEREIPFWHVGRLRHYQTSDCSRMTGEPEVIPGPMSGGGKSRGADFCVVALSDAEALPVGGGLCFQCHSALVVVVLRVDLGDFQNGTGGARLRF